MSTQRLSVLSPLLFFCFFRESFSICDGTTWTKVGWEIFPEEVHYLKVKVPPSSCLPYPLDKLCCNFANMDLLQSSLHLTYILVQALCLILFALSVHYLWMKWTRHQKKLKKQASLDKHANGLDLSPSIHDIEQILCRLLATTSMMTKFLKHVSHHSSVKKAKQQRKLRKKKSKGEEEQKITAIPKLVQM
uniref:Testis expressed 50 n=1 Tax=Mus spicilegus TaxID=10103 RepID=A0A8C6HMT6_MUSSI